MTLDDDEDDLSGGLGVGAAGASIKASAVTTIQDTPLPQTHLVMSTPVEDQQDTGAFRLDRHYVAMSETRHHDTLERNERVSDHLGPVLLIVAPLASAMAGAMTVLSKADDFSSGTWYAVATVFVVMLLGSVVLGLVLSGILFTIRLRWSFLLRFVFVASAAAVTYGGVVELPKHLQVRENDFPAFVLTKNR